MYGFAALRCCALAVSLVTTRRILDEGMHFPMHLLSLQLLASIACRTIRILFRGGVSWPFGKPERRSLLREHHIGRILYVASIASGFVCAYQAIHHVSNLAVVCAVLAISAWPSTRSAQGGEGPAMGPQSRSTIVSFVRWIGVATMILLDFRISVTGAVMLSLAGCSIHLAANLLPHPQTEDEYADSGLCSFALVAALLHSLFWCHFREQQYARARPITYDTLDICILAVNLVSTVMVFEFGPDPRRTGASRDTPTVDKIVFGDVWQFLALLVLVWTGSCLFLTIPPGISFLQLLGFGLCVITLLAERAWHKSMNEVADLKSGHPILLGPNTLATNKYSIVSGEEGRVEEGRLRQPVTSSTWSELIDTTHSMLLLLLSFTLVFVGLRAAILYSNPAHNSTAALRLFEPSHSVEVVIARYDETPTQIAGQLHELLKYSILGDLDVSVRIYNKGQEDSATFQDSLKQSFTSAVPVNASMYDRVVIETLPNSGRETDTYLEHITSQWDNLANHTIFMQAHVHHGPRAYLSRIEDYFTPETGFLSLADHYDGGGYCSSLDRCFDRDWTEDPTLLREIATDFSESDAEDGELLLTYRGQFVASSQRIRSTGREVYGRWLEKLRNPASKLHTSPYIDSNWSRKVDSISAPRVGYTMERMWAVMMKCGEKRIADRCPSLLNSYMCPRGGLCSIAAVRDCQCLDT